MDKAMIFDIEHSSFVDGPGIRTTIFFKGCNLQCAWCHNPESQINKPQMLFYKDKCIACGKCKEICPNHLENCDFCGKCELYCPANARKVCGKEYSVDDILTEVIKDKAFYENSGGGATFSGGECMLHIDFLTEILKKCKENGIHTAVDTAGHIKWESFEKVIPYTDLFLYDLKCINSERHKKHVGVGNELILDNLSRLLKRGCRVIVRIPLIPNVNDSAEDMEAIQSFFADNGQPEKVEILPYHAMGNNKYFALGKTPQQFEVPPKEMVKQYENLFV